MFLSRALLNAIGTLPAKVKRFTKELNAACRNPDLRTFAGDLRHRHVKGRSTCKFEFRLRKDQM